MQAISVFLRGRWFSSGALALTVIAWGVLALRSPLDAAALLRYGVDSAALHAGYGLLTAALIAVLLFEPHIRRELHDGEATALVVCAAGVIAFLIAGMVTARTPLERLLDFPMSLWIIVIHVIGLCALAVALVTDQPVAPASYRATGYAALVAGGLAITLIAAHVVSIGEYMAIDRPDEPWFASAALHFAQTGRLSPTYLASAYGDPDPVMPGYYALMGVWVRLTGDTLTDLRTVPLIIGLVSAVVTGAALWRAGMRARALIGVCALFTLTAFARASHNLRPDVLLALYGACVLAGLLAFYRKRSIGPAAIMGAALWIGMEGVPTAALVFGGLLGLLLIALCWRGEWRIVLVYAAACAAAIGLYAALHFLPDLSTRLGHLQAFFNTYREIDPPGGAALFDILSGYIAAFSLSLSPVELIAIVLAFALLIAERERALAVLVGVALLALPLFIHATYGYFALFAPFVAYAFASACRTRIALAITAFVLLPALAAPMLLDMIDAQRDRSNARAIAEADLLTWQIPTGITAAGDDLFWFTLAGERRFIGWEGIRRHTYLHDLTQAEAIRALGIDVLICQESDPACAALPSDYFAPPVEFVITSGRYLVYFREE